MNKKIKSIIRSALFIIGALLLVAVIGYWIFIRITNPDMTEMRLFMTYWWKVLLSMPVAICGILLVFYGTKA